MVSAFVTCASAMRARNGSAWLSQSIGFGLERPGVHDAGVVDEHVERPEAVLDAVEERGERRVVGDVDADPEGVATEVGGDTRRELAVEVADRDPGAVIHQRTGGR